MLVEIAWKNIWRKPSRSLVLVVAIAVGLAGGVFSIALVEGMMSQRNNDAINVNYSHLQIHTPEFDDFNKLKDTIPGISELIIFLDNDSLVKFHTERLKFTAMATSARSSTGIMLIGINPEQEKKVTTLYEKLLDTSQFFIDGVENSIVISTRIAQKLMLVSYQFDDEVENQLKTDDFPQEILEKIEPLKNQRFRVRKKMSDTLRSLLSSAEFEKYGDVIIEKSAFYKTGKKIILRFTDINGNLTDEAFRITGFYKTTDAMFDNMNVFVEKKYLAKLSGVRQTAATETAIILKNKNDVDYEKNLLSAKFPHLSVKSYKDLDPLMVVKGDFLNVYYYVIIGFILFALSFGIVNTVLMSVMERTKELGMLMAIGMKKTKVFLMIMIESIFVSLTGGVLGMAMGAFFSFYFSNKGIDMSSSSGAWETYGFSAVVYPELKLNFFVITTVLVILTGILSAVYPALKAVKLNPADAIRSDA